MTSGRFHPTPPQINNPRVLRSFRYPHGNFRGITAAAAQARAMMSIPGVPGGGRRRRWKPICNGRRAGAHFRRCACGIRTAGANGVGVDVHARSSVLQGIRVGNLGAAGCGAGAAAAGVNCSACIADIVGACTGSTPVANDTAVAPERDERHHRHGTVTAI